MLQTSELIPFGEWMPDLGSLNGGGALTASGCVPYGGKYKPFEELAEVTDALPSDCRGGFSYRDASGTVTIFAGTATKLYKLSGTAWVDVTRVSGGDYVLGVEDFWQFVPFGNLIIATNYVDDIQYFDITSSTEFAQLSATAPRCRYMAVVKNFLVCIDTVDGDGDLGYRVRWSPIGDPQGTWGSIPATQTDYQDIYESIYSNTFITPYGDFGVIVQGRAIWRMDYVGGDTIFDFNKLDQGRGSIYSQASVYNGQSIFLRAEDGFYEFTGGQMIPIGDKKVDGYFAANFNEAYFYNLKSAVDPIRKLVIWAVPHTGSAGGIANMLYIYSWIDKKFTIVDEETEVLFGFLTSSLTLEDLDAISASLDSLPFSLDSRAWTGGKSVLGAFSSNHKLSLFTGSARDATFGTAEVRLNAAGRAHVASVLPAIEGGTKTGRIGKRNTLEESVSWTSSVSQNTYTGALDFDQDAAYHQAEITVSGDWTIAHGLFLKSQPSGAA